MIIYKLAVWLANVTGAASDFYETGWNDGYTDALADISEEGY